MNYRNQGLVKKFSLLLLISFIIGFIVFFVLYVGGKTIANEYLDRSSYLERQAMKRIEDFQDYVIENNIKATDSDVISIWEKRNLVSFMEIYRDQYLLYSTLAPDNYYPLDDIEEVSYYDWAIYYNVRFADGDAQVVIYVDDLSIWNIGLFITSFIISVIVALFIFLFECKRIVKQIVMLNDYVKLMEGGDLDVVIPTLQDHELKQLASNLNSMREAFKSQMRREKEILNAHQTMITQMSHDLRTPLTTLQIYTDILRYKKYKPEMFDEYLKLIDNKSSQIKQLADNIFEYSLVSKPQDISLEIPSSIKLIFHDLLSEYIYQWSLDGFKVISNLNYKDIKICVYAPYIKRIMDNISSNIAKYAAKDRPISIDLAYSQDKFYLTIQNHIANFKINDDSTHIGLSNIEMMMNKMQGTSEVFKDKDTFAITLVFKEVIDRKEAH